MPGLIQFATRRIFEAMFALDEAGEPVDFAALDARLEDNDRTLLATAVFADETDSEVLSLEQGEACLSRLESFQRDERACGIEGQGPERLSVVVTWARPCASVPNSHAIDRG